VQLYAAIKEESHLQWLIERIDNFTDQSLIDLLQQLYNSEPTGECVFYRRNMCIGLRMLLYDHDSHATLVPKRRSAPS